MQYQATLVHIRKESEQIMVTHLMYLGMFWNHTEQVLYIKKFWLNLCRSFISLTDYIDFSRCRSTCRRFSHINLIKKLHTEILDISINCINKWSSFSKYL
jgi:hypothetical protein